MSVFGFLCCHKPPGMTSRAVVNIVQGRLRRELCQRNVKVGHAGTLDPLAEGVLVLGVGPAARLVPYVQQQPKHYQATFRLGQSTLSGDLEDQPTQHPDLPRPTPGQIDKAARSLVGRIEQTPPAHSAVWVDGQRAYKRVRAGESFEMPVRIVEVHSLEVSRYEFPEIDLEIVCGSGTYVRSLGIDLAIAAGSIAVMSHLVRTAVGPFAIQHALSIDQLRMGRLQEMLLPPTLAVRHLDQITVAPADSQRLGHGMPIDHPEVAGIEGAPVPCEAAAITTGGQLRAIVRWKRGAWYPYRVFPA